jgi:hypothetical protein
LRISPDDPHRADITAIQRRVHAPAGARESGVRFSGRRITDSDCCT